MTDDNRAAQRETAAYASAVNWLRHTTELTEDELDRAGLEAVEDSVYGHDAPRNRDGTRREQGIGSPGRETANHFASILRYQGKDHWEKAVREIQKRDPERHVKLGLPKLPPEVT